jgi:hypothetical protein
MLIRWIALLMLGCALTTGVHADDADAPGYLERDLADLTAMFEGRWDNDRHNFFAEAAGVDAATLAPRQHLTIAPLEGQEHAFTVLREVADEDPTSLIHRFAVDAERLAIRQHMFAGERRLECAVFWHRVGGQFRGEARGSACNELFPRPVGDEVGTITMALSEREFWISVERAGAVIDARMRRARPFTCWTAVMRGASHGDDTQGMRDWQFTQGVKIHDQGGEAVLTTDEETPRTVRLKLRDVDWTYGTRRPSLTLYAYEGDDDRAVSYAWTGGGSDRIGLNLRWLQASCTADDAQD